MPKKPYQIVDSTWPLYRRYIPPPMKPGEFSSRRAKIDLTNTALPPFGDLYNVAEAVQRLDRRAAAAVSSAAGLEDGVNIGPTAAPDTDLLEGKYSGDDHILIPTSKCLAILAFYDYFPELIEQNDKRPLVSEAILRAHPGWCGTFGPGADGLLAEIKARLGGLLPEGFRLFKKPEEGNYDMTQMHLLQMVYRHYEQLSPEALNLLVTVLLATGRIHRPNLDDRVTSGGPPNDWSRAGFLELPLPIIGGLFGIHPKLKRIGETENHILTIHTARYLTNQLLYQRDPSRDHDNRSNGYDGAPSAMEMMLILLHNILRDDFSEYNAKNYQNETRYALLNLCSYAYDHEVRLAARMVLDYISAHIAVSSNDLRRMVPFRRRNEGVHSRRAAGFMEVGLVETSEGADPMTPHFAILAGNTRTYSTPATDRPKDCINSSGKNGHDAVADALSEYRLPPSIHDLFITDMHRRFFQRLSRVPLDDEEITGRNCSNYEIYASSPSYLITAGGSPATYAVDPRIAGKVLTDEDQQLGVAVTTSFMPTGTSAGRPNVEALTSADTLQNSATEIIQFSSFSDKPGKVSNYGVAPDFACGHVTHMPVWCQRPINGSNDHIGQFRFVNAQNERGGPGFFLAIYRESGFCVMEAFDTWLHPNVLTFDEFKRGVIEKNGQLDVRNDVENTYITHSGHRIHFNIWAIEDRWGALVNKIEYGSPADSRFGNANMLDSLGDAGNSTNKFLSGTIMDSDRDSALVRIRNPHLQTVLELNMRDMHRPKRIAEDGSVEEAGSNQEVWVNFNWHDEQRGDFFHPFNTLAGAVAAVADGGTIRIMPGQTTERFTFLKAKRYSVVAPAGGVAIGI